MTGHHNISDKIRKAFGAVWTLVLLGAGQVGAQNPQPVADQLMLDGGPLQAYYTYLVNLDRGQMEALPLAVAEFERQFSGAAPAACDSAFVLLEDFAMTVLDQTKFNDYLLKAAESPRSAREKQAADKYLALLARNYFLVRYTPDEVLVRPDLDAVRERIGRYLSDGTRTFFVLSAMEAEQPYGTGERLAITWQQLADRLIGWERFLNDYAGSIYADEARQRRDAYLEILVFGLPDSPICGEDGRVGQELKAVYQRLMNNPVGLTGKVITDYWSVLSKYGFHCTEPAVLFFTY
ncbi:MAG: hypothetical protein K2L03_00870, partial [Bacteroidales bacterium]|nr:hypothetical protein [Bacteroidales bacterium]